MRQTRYRQYYKIKLKYKLALETDADVIKNLDHIELLGSLLLNAKNKVATISLSISNR